MITQVSQIKKPTSVETSTLSVESIHGSRATPGGPPLEVIAPRPDDGSELLSEGAVLENKSN